MDWCRIWIFLKQVRQSRWLGAAINIMLGIWLIVFVGRYVLSDWNQIQNQIVFDPLHLGMALGFYGITLILFSIAWHSIVIRFNGPASWKQNVLYYSYTHLTKFLPTPIWFLGGRVYLYGKTGVQRRTTMAMTALETLLHALTGLSFYALLMIDVKRPVTWLYMFALVPHAIMLFRPQWLALHWITGNKLKLHILRKDVITWLVLYLLTWIVAGPFFSSLIYAISSNTPPHLSDLWRIWTLASLIAYVGTYTLGGIGILREFTLTWFLKKFYPPSVTILIAVGIRLILIGGGVIWGIIISTLVTFSPYFDRGRSS